MSHEYGEHIDDAGSSLADLATGHPRGRLPSGDDGQAVRTERDGRMADGLSKLPAIEIPPGERACDECLEDPDQYLADFGVTCPTCLGLGHFPDPDFYDADDVFDARSEWGSMPRLRGNGRGQL